MPFDTMPFNQELFSDLIQQIKMQKTWNLVDNPNVSIIIIKALNNQIILLKPFELIYSYLRR